MAEYARNITDFLSKTDSLHTVLDIKYGKSNDF